VQLLTRCNFISLITSFLIQYIIHFAGFLHSLENVGRQYEPMGSELKGEAGEDLIAGVSTSAFVTAVMEVHKVRLLAAIIPSFSFDPLYRCFICADEGITDRNDGKTDYYCGNI